MSAAPSHPRRCGIGPNHAPKLCTPRASQRVEAVRRREVTQALDHVVEANMLLSGNQRFESAGIAAAHAVAQGLTVLLRGPANYLHGETVRPLDDPQSASWKGVTKRRRAWHTFAVPLGFPRTWATSTVSMGPKKTISAAVWQVRVHMWSWL